MAEYGVMASELKFQGCTSEYTILKRDIKRSCLNNEKEVHNDALNAI